MLATPFSGVFTLTSPPPRDGDGVLALHFAVSRSAAVRLAPVVAALSALGAPQAVVDSGGQHEPAPALPPRLPPGEAAEAAMEAALERTRPALALIAGDGEAAVAAALAAARHGVPIARLGAGLRTGDRTLAGEVNRLVLDELAELLLADGEDAVERLRAEGAEERRIRCVGSTVPDVALRWHPAASRRATASAIGLPEGGYVLVTLHKPENLADDERVARITEGLGALAARIPVVLVAHRETRAALARMDGLERLRAAGAVVVDTLEYLDFLSLESAAGLVLTDSAAVQEETTMLGVPCATFARSSERTLTLTRGTNLLLGDDPADIAQLELERRCEPLDPIPLWDGGAGRRVAAELLAWGRA